MSTGVGLSKLEKQQDLNLIYVNDNNLTIETDAMNYMVKVYNLLGILIDKGHFSGTKTLNLNHFPTGSFFISVESLKSKTVKKIFITNE